MQMLRQRQQHIMLNSSLNTSQNSNSSTATGGSHAIGSHSSSSTGNNSSSNNNHNHSNNNGLGSLSLDHHQHPSSHHSSSSIHAQSQHLHNNNNNTSPHSNSHHFSMINSGLTLYSPDGIKQELIQIPHLSSSTSSPDSSPSPLNSQLNMNGPHVAASNPTHGPLSAVNGGGVGTANAAALTTGHHPHHHQSVGASNASSAGTNPHFSGFGALELNSVAASHPELVKWVNSAAGSSSAPSPLSNVPTSLHHSSSGLGAPNGSPLNTPIASGSNSNLLHAHSLKSSGSSFSFGSTDTGAGSPSGFVSPNHNNNSIELPFVVQKLQITAMDDKEWQAQLFGLLNNQTYNQCEVDLFELMCKVIDQSLFTQVDWARNSIFFKDLKIDDQMKLLQQAWSNLLVLDHIHHRLQHGLQDEVSLPNGQKFDLVGLALLGVPSALPALLSLQNKLVELKFDSVDYLCLKFLLLLNPGAYFFDHKCLPSQQISK